MAIFKIRIEHFIIAILAILLLIKSCGAEGDCATVEAVTTIENKTVTKKDTSSVPGIKNRKPVKVNVIETPTSVRIIESKKDLQQTNGNGHIKQVYRYQDTTRLIGSTIFSDILTEGRILDFRLTTEIDHTEKTITTKETLVKNAGGLFISPGINYSPINGLDGIETTLTYIKGPLGASAGGYYNFRSINQAPGSFGLKFKLHIKL